MIVLREREMADGGGRDRGNPPFFCLPEKPPESSSSQTLNPVFLGFPSKSRKRKTTLVKPPIKSKVTELFLFF